MIADSPRTYTYIHVIRVAAVIDCMNKIDFVESNKPQQS